MALHHFRAMLEDNRASAVCNKEQEMSGPSIDIGVFEWVIGGVAAMVTAIGGTLFGLAYGVLSGGIERIEASAEKSRTEIWDAIDKLTTNQNNAAIEFEKRMGQYPTRGDVYNLGKEIKQDVADMKDDMETSLTRTLAEMDRRFIEIMKEHQRATIDMVRSTLLKSRDD